MKTSRVMQCSRIFPLIIVLTLSGCGGAGSGKLAESECKSLEKLMRAYQDLSKILGDPSEVMVKLGISLEQYNSGGCSPLEQKDSKKLSDSECEDLEGFVEYYKENAEIAVQNGTDPTYSTEKLFEYADKYDDGGCGTSSLLD
jgi:hypothetical protein